MATTFNVQYSTNDEIKEARLCAKISKLLVGNLHVLFHN